MPEQIEIDVAEKVMGWRLDRTSKDDPPRIRWYKDKRDPDADYAVGAPDYIRSRWCPSTLIQDAMMVVEHMAGQGWGVTISNDNEQAEHDWFVEFTRSEPSILYTGDGDSDSLPLAICEAALEAVADYEASQSTSDSNL